MPGILQNLVTQTNDPGNNNFNIQDIFNSLSGGRTQGFDVQGLLGKVTKAAVWIKMEMVMWIYRI